MIPLSSPGSCLREPSHLSGKDFSLLPEPRDKMSSSQPLRRRRGANPLANSAREVSFLRFPVQTSSNRGWNTCLLVLSRRENCVHMETFSCSSTLIILFCNQRLPLQNLFSFILFFSINSFPCPEEKKMTVSPFSPKLEEFRLSP